MQLDLADGGRLAYEIQGEGPPLLMIPPLGSSLLAWDRFAEVLARDLRVITYDPRGVGASSASPLWGTTRQMARDALALLDHLTLSQAHVYGISLGGMVASSLAILAPHRVSSLVLAATVPSGIQAQKPRDAWGLLRCLAGSPAAATACLSTRILTPRFRREHEERVRRVQELATYRPASHRGLLSLAVASARHNVRARLREIGAPTLVLVGECDPIASGAPQRELMRSLPRAECAVVPGAGHNVSVEAPDETAALVLAHVLRQRAS